MNLLLGIDLGTSYFKVGLFSERGELKGLGRIPVDKVNLAPGRYELPVENFWRLLRLGLAEALTQVGGRANQIIALSYSSQVNSFLLLDASQTPLTPIVFWTDTRGEPVEDDLAAFATTEIFRRTTGFGGLTGQWMVTKLRWFAKNKPTIWARTRRIMTISDYLTYALTGEYVGDASTAAFLGILDLKNQVWWPDALDAFAIAADRLSTPLPPGSSCGRTLAHVPAMIGVPAGIPVAVGGLDHHVAAIGSGLGRLADTSISTGTVLAALTLVNDPAPRAGCYHGPHVDGDRYYRLAFDPNGAGQLEDYQRRFAPELSIEQLIALAGRAPPRVGPLGDVGSDGRKSDLGIEVRYLLEKIAVTHRDLVRRVAGAGGVRKIVATGGGARSAKWLQIKADTLGVPIVTSACSERACLGAAVFAAVAAGHYLSVAEASLAMVHANSTFEPSREGMAIYHYRIR
jgi:sugar (pentulose or hexulose) kinase